MWWLYRLADHVIAKGPFVTAPAYDAATHGVVELHDPHINPRTNRITADGTNYRLATPEEIAAFDTDARAAIRRERARLQREYEEE